MTDSAPFSHYVVQTLVVDKWRSFDRYTREDEAQKIARQLIPEWGALRVRLLGGYFDDAKARNVYHRVTIREAVKTGPLQRFRNSKLVVGSSALGGAMLGLILIVYAFVAPLSSMADDARASEIIRIKPAPVVPIVQPVDMRARFVEEAKVPYGKTRAFDTMPIRLQGSWSTACGQHGDKLILGVHHIAPGDGREHGDTLSTVWQTGQSYGLLLEDGSVYMVDMIAVDSIKKIGTLSKSGDFTADSSGTVFKRCL